METNEPYQAEFPPGTSVRIVAAPILEQFVASWRYHHPLLPAQLAYAGAAATVANVSFYHGGDQLYELVGIPGIWHQQNLTPN